MIKTFRFRIKDSNRNANLNYLASKVNLVFNYINETSEIAWRRDRRWLSQFDFDNLTSGSSEELGLPARTIQSISTLFVVARKKAKRCRLNWRSSKRSLGWIPIKAKSVKIKGDTLIFQKKKYRFWKSREIEGKIKNGSFSQNAKGQWFINLNCEVESISAAASTEEVGIDLGLKILATLSNGEKIENPRVLQKYADKLAMAQRAGKKKQVTSIHNKIKNVRKDFLHKESTKLVKRYKVIYVGDVNSSKLVKTRMAKSVLDSGWGMFKSMLAYKAVMLGMDFKVVNEKYSSITCSSCLQKTGPSGLSGLGVREWDCVCGSHHDRDVNAAKNILRIGHDTLIEEPLIA